MILGPAAVTFTTPGFQNSTIVVEPDEVPADGESACSITVTVLDADDGPGSGVSVSIVTNSSTCVVTPDGSVLTDSSGVAGFAATNEVVEAVSFSAKLGGTTTIT